MTVGRCIYCGCDPIGVVECHCGKRETPHVHRDLAGNTRGATSTEGKPKPSEPTPGEGFPKIRQAYPRGSG